MWIELLHYQQKNSPKCGKDIAVWKWKIEKEKGKDRLLRKCILLILNHEYLYARLYYISKCAEVFIKVCYPISNLTK